MTAVRRRRTRSMVIALAAALVGVVAAAALGVAGVRSLSDSTAGRQADGQRDDGAMQRLPFTSTALVAVVDDDRQLTSAAIWVLQPTGVGGYVIGVAATADAASGTVDTLAPLAAVYDVGGAEDFLAAAERLTGLSFDVVEVMDQRRFAQVIAPLGDLPALLPATVTDASSGEEWIGGETTLGSAAAARLLTATDPTLADYFFESSRAAVWQAVADRVGAGIGSIEPIASDEDVPVPTSVDQFAARLFGAPVEFRGLGFTPIDEERAEEGLPEQYVGLFGEVDAVVAHDRSEMAVLFGAAAPGRVGAPLDAPVFRIVSPYSDADLEGTELNSTDVLEMAVDRLLFAQANVVSVADLPESEVPEVTLIEVADAEVTRAVREAYEPLFGEIEVVPAAVRVEGIDIEVTLGRTYLERLLRGDAATGMGGSADDE